MRSRAPLSVIEQLIMLLVFALAAAVCLRAFAWSDAASRRSLACDRALTEAQSVASVIRQTRGDLEAAAALLGGSVREDSWSLEYDADWIRVAGAEDYRLRVTSVDTGLELLGGACIVVEQKGEELVRLEVSWQEVAEDEG